MEESQTRGEYCLRKSMFFISPLRRMVYETHEIEISYRYLKTVVSRLEEPICLIGGWAVYHHVNKNFLEKDRSKLHWIKRQCLQVSNMPILFSVYAWLIRLPVGLASISRS